MNKSTYTTIAGVLLPAFVLAAGYYMMKNKDWCMFKDPTAMIIFGAGALGGYQLLKKLK